MDVIFVISVLAVLRCSKTFAKVAGCGLDLWGYDPH